MSSLLHAPVLGIAMTLPCPGIACSLLHSEIDIALTMASPLTIVGPAYDALAAVAVAEWGGVAASYLDDGRAVAGVVAGEGEIFGAAASARFLSRAIGTDAAGRGGLAAAKVRVFEP